MLPPAHLRQSLILAQSKPLLSHAVRASATAVLRGGLATNQPRRTFWGWRRNLDYTSHLDPLYHRFCRVRTLKTRAKLLRKLQRRGKFEWEGHGADFFTPKHVRWATRWDGPGGRRPWWVYPVNDPNIKDSNGSKSAGKEGASEDGLDGMELSQREKMWKEQMERMRKRIEQDPYEAIFGKRFEPFWSPLVPSWMREEMGLPVWKMKGEIAEAAKKAESKTEPKHAEKVVKNETSKTPDPPKKDEKAAVAPKVQPEAPKSKSYSYASSTSWDSWSNKTRRVEWDSMSGQTKKYEYDPISNRMVQVEAPKPVEPKKIAPTPEQTKKSDEKTISIPVKQSSSELRQSIPIPPPLSQPSHSIPIGFSTTTTTTSIGPLKSTAIASDVPKSTAIATDVPKPSAVAKVPDAEKPPSSTATPKEPGLESLTAEDVRANMGKTRSSPPSQIRPDESFGSFKTQLGALLMERHISKDLPVRNRHSAGLPIEKSEWDKAELSVFYDKELESLHKKKEKLIKDERGLFHIERQKRELMKLDTRIKELVARVERLNESTDIASADSNAVDLASARASGVAGLQSSLDRMQSKTAPRAAIEKEDPDDSAAHESTEPITSATAPGVPRDWDKQANLLQAARVRRSAIARSYPSGSSASKTAQSITPAEISARKKANEARRAADEAKAAEEIAKIKAEKARIEREQKLEKANKMLEDEVREQKVRMQSHENRYAHKIRSLRGELETAYKQSAVHGEKHLERIRSLETELERAQKAIGELAAVDGKGKGTAAGNFTNWYRQATWKMEQAKKENELSNKQLKKRDKELVKEIKSIYENRYGPIEDGHRQPSEAWEQKFGKAGIVEVESNVDLGEALAEYEKEHEGVYGGAVDQKREWRNKFKELNQSLERQLAAQEREANEGIKLVDDKLPKLIPTELAQTREGEESAVESVQQTVQWEIPPLYKVLAYDSGNDRISTATTTSNWTGSETPISIPEALNQLYAPARFVGEFANLQREGYQVIYGSKELLVFRKVAEAIEDEAEAVRPALEDHGLVAGENHPDHWSVPKASEAETAADPKPVDPAESSTAKESLPDESQNVFDTETDWRHYPRVKRDEFPHFTGTKRKWRSKKRHSEAWKAIMEHSEPNYEEDIHKDKKRARAEARRERRRQEHRFWRRLLGGTAIVAGATYLIGSAAEKSRKEAEAARAMGSAGLGASAEEWARKAEKAVEKAEKEGGKWMWK